MEKAALCDGKKALSASSALEEAESLHIRCYKCPNCGHWHIGHKMLRDTVPYKRPPKLVLQNITEDYETHRMVKEKNHD